MHGDKTFGLYKKPFTRFINAHDLLCLNLWFVPLSGCSPEGPCPDSHWREAVSLPHLRHPLSPLADPEEPPAHSHRRKTLHREWGAQDTLTLLLFVPQYV